ncbi:MAG TPA: glycine cleavage system protein GcvH [Bdellovibrionota bacterium]|jgi:glycine cleavage system H protein|nr:glycine cleavage system protein GcvH [Bdellovibrionota bacterium]
MRFPKEYKYTQDHEWARVEGKTVTVGITDHAQSSLGDVVFLELPKVGRTLKKGEAFGVVESVKAVSDLYSPVDGKVIEVHSDLVDDPGTINKEPHDGGWLVKIELTSADGAAHLMDAAAYEKLVASL